MSVVVERSNVFVGRGEDVAIAGFFFLSEDKDLEENVVDPCRESSINVSGVENAEVGEVKFQI